jgi:hypothetical protein
MNPVEKILGYRRDVSKNKIYIDKNGNIMDTDAFGEKRVVNIEKEDEYGNLRSMRIRVPSTGKVGKMNVEKEVFDIVDNPNLTQTQKEKLLKPFEAYINAKGWKFW